MVLLSPAPVAQSAAEAFARLAASCCGVEAGLFLRVHDGRFEVQGAYGLRGDVETLRGSAIFAATLRHRDILEVVQRPKSAREQRQGEHHVYRFYAGVAVRAADGTPLGVVVVLDPSARMLEPRARDQMRLLAQGLSSLDMAQPQSVLELVIRCYERSPEPTLVYVRRETEVRGQLVCANRAFERMAGVVADTLLSQGLDALLGPKTDQTIAAAMRTAQHRGKPMRATLALYPAGNRTLAPRWFEVSGYPVEAETSGVHYWVESYHDVTERASRITELATERNRLQFTLASMDEAVVTADRFGKLLFMNHAARDLFADGVLQLRDLETEKVLISPLEYARKNGSIKRERALVLTKDDTRRYVEYSVAPIERPNQQSDGFVIVMRDVTEEEGLTRRLSFEASHDQLTSIFNRRYFDQALGRALNSLKHREEAQHALAFLDLDRFKIINDTCGHAAGDDVLRDVAQLFKKQLRGNDVLARFGGDEFAILMHDCPLPVAARIMERIRAKLQDYVFPWDGYDFRLGVSIGLAEITPKTTSAQEVMKAADAACYADKLQRKTKQAGTIRGNIGPNTGIAWLR